MYSIPTEQAHDCVKQPGVLAVAHATRPWRTHPPAATQTMHTTEHAHWPESTHVLLAQRPHVNQNQDPPPHLVCDLVVEVVRVHPLSDEPLKHLVTRLGVLALLARTTHPVFWGVGEGDTENCHSQHTEGVRGWGECVWGVRVQGVGAQQCYNPVLPCPDQTTFVAPT